MSRSEGLDNESYFMYSTVKWLQIQQWSKVKYNQSLIGHISHFTSQVINNVIFSTIGCQKPNSYAGFFLVKKYFSIPSQRLSSNRDSGTRWSYKKAKTDKWSKTPSAGSRDTSGRLSSFNSDLAFWRQSTLVQVRDNKFNLIWLHCSQLPMYQSRKSVEFAANIWGRWQFGHGLFSNKRTAILWLWVWYKADRLCV